MKTLCSLCTRPTYFVPAHWNKWVCKLCHNNSDVMIILILRQLVFVLTPQYCRISGESANTNRFGLTRQGYEPPIYYTEHTNHYTTDAVTLWLYNRLTSNIIAIKGYPISTCNIKPFVKYFIVIMQIIKKCVIKYLTIYSCMLIF